MEGKGRTDVGADLVHDLRGGKSLEEVLLDQDVEKDLIETSGAMIEDRAKLDMVPRRRIGLA